MPSLSVKKLALCVVLPILVVFIAERFYKTQLYQQSLEDAPKMQQKKSLYGFFSKISWMGEIYLPLAALIVVFNIVPKVKAVYIWSALGFIAYANGLLKTLYAEPRPFWVSSDIHPSQCRGGFGNPSGHCMCTSFFWVTLLLHKYYEVGNAIKMRSIFCTAYIIKMALIAALSIFLIFLGVSRVYLGEHTYNEVVFGTQIGILFAFIGHYFVKPYMMDMPGVFKRWAQSSRVDALYHVPFYLLALALVATWILPLAIQYALWQYGSATYPSTPEWDQRIKASCNQKQYPETTSMYNLGLLQSGVVGIIAGSVLGHLFEMKFISLQISNSAWNQTSLKVTVMRTIATAIMFCLLESAFFIISDDQEPSQLIYLWMCKFSLPIFLGTFGVFAFSKTIFYKLHLVNENAIGRETEGDIDTESDYPVKNKNSSLEFMDIEMSHKVQPLR